MTTLKTLTIVAALLAGATSLALAQNGPPTGGESPVAGGANGNSVVPGPTYPAAPGPGYSGYYLEAPGYAAQPGYAGQPGYVEESGTAATPRRAATVHHRSMYMYAPVQGSSAHRRKKSSLKAGLTNGGY
jgi:hypothetical protein